ncbi:hypothetical protein Tco_0869504 [Tanacetum coccineum]
MDDDIFTYEVEVANIQCDSNKDDDSKHEIRRDDEVELKNEEFFDNEDEVAEVFKIDTNIFDFETPIPMKIKRMIGSMNGTRTYHGWMNDGYYNGGNLPGTYIIGNQLHYQNYEWYKALEDSELKDEALRNKAIGNGYSRKRKNKAKNDKTEHENEKSVKRSQSQPRQKWPTCSWMNDGYYNGGNLPGTYIIGNQLHYQDYEWYEALEDSEFKDEALRNKAIMEGFIKEDDDESRYEQMRRWNINANYDDAYETNHGDNKSKELCDLDNSTSNVLIPLDSWTSGLLVYKLPLSGIGWTLGGSRGESFWEEGDDFGVDVLRFHTCLTDILGFLEKLEWWFEQDIDDEGEVDEEPREEDVNWSFVAFYQKNGLLLFGFSIVSRDMLSIYGEL